MREVDADVCGPYILGRGMEYLNTMNDKTKESRALFLGFAKLHSLKILNTTVSKTPDRLITYKCKIQNTACDTTVEAGPPFDAVIFAQIDFWLAGCEWKSCVLNTQSRKDIYFDSDHFVLEAQIKVSAFISKHYDKEKHLDITNRRKTDG